MTRYQSPILLWSLHAVMLTGLLGIVVAASLGGRHPVAGQPVLVVASGATGGALRIIEAAGGRAVGPAVAPFGGLAIFDGAVPVQKLRDLGAWGVRDGSGLARLCGVTST